jgi:cytochrome c5
MRRRILLTVLALTLTVLAGTAAYAQHKAGQYEPGSAGKIARPAARESGADAVYDVGPLFTYRPALAPSDGSREVETYCNTCHSPMYITMQPPLSADAWAAEVTKMQKTFGADIPNEITKKIVLYLGTHYTPDTRKR